MLTIQELKPNTKRKRKSMIREYRSRDDIIFDILSLMVTKGVPLTRSFLSSKTNVPNKRFNVLLLDFLIPNKLIKILDPISDRKQLRRITKNPDAIYLVITDLGKNYLELHKQINSLFENGNDNNNNESKVKNGIRINGYYGVDY